MAKQTQDHFMEKYTSISHPNDLNFQLYRFTHGTCSEHEMSLPDWGSQQSILNLLLGW